MVLNVSVQRAGIQRAGVEFAGVAGPEGVGEPGGAPAAAPLNVAEQAPAALQELQAINPGVVSPKAGGMQFAQALNPKLEGRRAEALNAVAEMTEGAGIAFAMTATGRERLKDMKAAGTLYTPVASSYSDLFAIGGEKPSAETSQRLARLQRIEESIAAQQTLALNMQVDPVGLRMEANRLKGELDRDTQGIRVQKERRDNAIQRRDVDKIAEEARDKEVEAILDKRTNGELKEVLVGGAGPSSIDPRATNMDIMRLLDRRNKMGLAVGPEGRSLTKEERAEMLERTLSGLRPADLLAAAEHVTAQGAAAYIDRDVAKQMQAAGSTDAQSIAREAELDRTHSTIAGNLRRMTGGLNPTINELNAAAAKQQELIAKRGLTAGQVAYNNARSEELQNLDLAMFEQRSQALTEAGAPVDVETTFALRRRMAAGYSLLTNAATPQERKEAGEFIEKVKQESRAQLDKYAESLTADKAALPAIRNFVNEGEVASSSDGATLLANAAVRGVNTYSRRSYSFNITTQDGAVQQTAVPLSNPAQTAQAALQPALDSIIKDADQIADPALRLQYQQLQGKDKNKAVAPLTMEREEALLRLAHQGLSRQQKIAGRVAYDDAMRQGTLIALINQHIGTDIKSKELQERLIETSERGSGFRREFTSIDPESKLAVLDTGKLAQALYKAGRGDVLGKALADLENQEVRNGLLANLAPKNMREKAMFAFLEKDDSFVQASPTGIIVGQQQVATHANRRVFNRLQDFIKRGIDAAQEGTNASNAQQSQMNSMAGFELFPERPSSAPLVGDLQANAKRAYDERRAIYNPRGGK